MKLIWKLLGVLALISLILLAAFRGWAHFREAVPAGSDGGAPGQFIEADGLRIHYMTWGPENGVPILLIPGTLAWSGTWIDITGKLAESGHRVIAVDLPPFGYSERAKDGDYSRQAQARRITAFMDKLALRTIVLVGHSFGGGATVETAFMQQDRICLLALLDVALRLDNPAPIVPLRPLFSFDSLRTLLMSATFANPLMIGKGLRDFIENDALVTEERIAIYRKPMDRTETSSAIGDWFLTGLFGDERNSLSAKGESYNNFKKRVLIIWGRNDTVTPLEQGERINAIFPNSQLHVLGKVNHIPHVELPGSVAGLLNRYKNEEMAKGCR